MRSVVVVFARAPVLGEVKTRLAASIGEDAALALYRAMLDDACAAAAACGAERRVLCVAGDHQHPELANLIDNYRMDLLPQSEGDLGTRMATAFDQQFKSGAERVCIIGSDSPLLRADELRQAFFALSTHPVVVGPATDGGYYLVGLKEPMPIFHGIDWSTPNVLQQTLARVPAGDAALLSFLPDVDDAADLARLKALMRHSDAGVGPHTRATLEID